MMKKTVVFWISVLLSFSFLCMPAAADGEAKTGLREAYDSLYSDSGAADLPDALPDEARAWVDSLGLSPGEPERFSNGLGEGMLAALLSLASEGVGAPAKGLAVCLGAVLLFAAFGALGGEGIGKTAGYAAVCAAAGGLFPLVQTVLTAVCAVGGTGKFMAAFVPVYAGILLAGGKAATAAGFQTLLLFAATAASGVIGGLVIPFVSLYTALSFSASATSLPVGRLTEGIKKAATWLLGLLLTLFGGVLGIQTAVSAAGDSLSMKTVRFVAGSFLPVVGASVGEALGTVESCVSLLRTGVGAYGVVGVLAILLPVFLQLCFWRLSLLLSEAAGELFGCGALASLYRNVGSAVSILIGVTVWTALLFIISLTVVVLAGGG